MSDYEGSDVTKILKTTLVLANFVFFTFVGTYTWQRDINLTAKMIMLKNRIELLELQTTKVTYPPEPIYDHGGYDD